MAEVDIDFSPILIMDFIRQMAVVRVLNSEDLNLSTKFKISKKYYDEIANFYIQAPFIGLNPVYDESSEILTVKPEERVIEHFKSQKSLIEMCGKCEGLYKERYKAYVEVCEA